MAKGAKLTFKKHKKETGLRAIGNPYASVDIKRNGKRIGIIDAPNWMSKDRKWVIRLAIKQQPEPTCPCPFGWVTLKTKFDLEEGAREFIKMFGDELQSKFDLHEFDD